MRVGVEEKTCRVVRVDVDRARFARFEPEWSRTQLANSKRVNGAADASGRYHIPRRVNRLIMLHAALLGEDSIANVNVGGTFAVNADSGNFDRSVFSNDVEHDAVVGSDWPCAAGRREAARNDARGFGSERVDEGEFLEAVLDGAAMVRINGEEKREFLH